MILKQKLVILFLVCSTVMYANDNTSQILLLYSQQKYTEVIEQANLAIKEGTVNVPIYYYKGLAERALYRYNSAVNSFQNALATDSTNFQLMGALADAYELSGNDVGAVEIYKKQIQTDTTNIPARANLARLLKSQKEYGQAIELYSKLVELDSTNGHFFAQLGFCCSKFGLLPPVVPYYTKALELNGFDLETGKLLINELIDQKFYDDAQYYIDTLVTKFIGNVYLLKQRAYILALGGNYLDAVRAFEKVVVLGDSSMFTCKFYGQSLYNNGQYSDAVFWLDKYLKHNQDDTKNQFIMGLACQKDYRYEKSILHLTIALEQLYNKDLISKVFEETGNTYMKYGDYIGFRDSTKTKALEKYNLSRNQYLMAIEVQPTNFDIYRSLGILYYQKYNNSSMALHYYEEYYKNLDTSTINEHQLEWIQGTISKLKEELHFEVE